MRLGRWLVGWWFAGIVVGAIIGVLVIDFGEGFSNDYLFPAIIGAGVGALIAVPFATLTAVLRDVLYRRKHP